MLTVGEVASLLELDAVSGKIYWKSSPRKGVAAGSEAGYLNVNGYRYVKVYGTQYRSHRIVWALHYRRWPDLEVDHINGTKDDNRPDNLREATKDQNAKNRKLNSNNTSGCKGVSQDKATGKWRAYISSGNKWTHLGLFPSKAEAAATYAAAANTYHGEFASV